MNADVMLTHAKSKGSVTLKSRNHKEDPNVDNNFLSHPQDMATFLKGILLEILCNKVTKLHSKYIGRQIYVKLIYFI